MLTKGTFCHKVKLFTLFCEEVSKTIEIQGCTYISVSIENSQHF